MLMVNHPNRARSGTMDSPSPAEIRSARARAGLTQTAAAELVHAHLNSWQQWEAELGSPANRRMHPGIWELFMLKTGQATLTPPSPAH